MAPDLVILEIGYAARQYSLVTPPRTSAAELAVPAERRPGRPGRAAIDIADGTGGAGADCNDRTILPRGPIEGDVRLSAP